MTLHNTLKQAASAAPRGAGQLERKINMTTLIILYASIYVQLLLLELSVNS